MTFLLQIDGDWRAPRHQLAFHYAASYTRGRIAECPRVVYTSHYNIGSYGLARLHSFDSRKYGRDWKLLRRYFGPVDF